VNAIKGLHLKFKNNDGSQMIKEPWIHWLTQIGGENASASRGCQEGNSGAESL
jgi:hypothetical protein